MDQVPPEFRAAFEKLTKELDARPQSQSSIISNDAQQPQQEKERILTERMIQQVFFLPG